MTREKSILILDSLSTWLGYEKPITEEIVEAIKTLSQSSLPSNLDEAAKESLPEAEGFLKTDIYGGSEAVYSREQMLAMYKAGANWRDAQIPKLPDSLDKAAKEYANKEYPDEPSCGQWGTGDYEPPVDMEYPREIAKEAYISGVRWYEQISRNTLNGHKEAAKNLINAIFFKDGRYDGDFIMPICEDIFKAGAEWMAGQGYTKEETVYFERLCDENRIMVDLGWGEPERGGFNPGDKVIVQIRKKQ